MRLRSLLTQLHQLIRLFDRQSIQVHTIDGLIEMHGRCAQITTRPITLTKRVIARKRIIRIIQQELKLLNSLVPTLLLLIEPTKKVSRIRPIETTLQDLLAEVDSIIETALVRQNLRLL